MKIYLENTTESGSVELLVTADTLIDGDDGLWIRIGRDYRNILRYQYEHVTVHASDEYDASRLLPDWALSDRLLDIIREAF